MALDYAGYSWRSALYYTPGQLTEDFQQLEPHISFQRHSLIGFLDNRWRRQISGQTLGLVPCFNGRPVGLVVVGVWHGAPRSLTTGVYLIPEMWGSGLSAACRMMYWEIAQWCSRELFVTIDPSNTRSLIAARKIWPKDWRLISEPWKPAGRVSWVHRVIEPPPWATTLSIEQKESLAHILSKHPGSTLRL